MLRLLTLIFRYCLLLIAIPIHAQHHQTLRTEILVTGGTTGGIAAGLQAAHSGVKTIIVEQTPWLGGMLTAAGVSCTDGNDVFRSGIWQRFRGELKKHYQRKYLSTGWVSNTCFEPRVGDSIFKSWVKQEANLAVYYEWFFDKAFVKRNKVIGARFINLQNDTLTVYATLIIDATDLGDVFASAGCAYDLGTEDSSQSNESIAPGKSDVIQDMTWAATLQDFGPGTDMTIPKPPGYQPTDFYCSTADAPCNLTPYMHNTAKVLDYGKLPVTKGGVRYMLNWPAHGNDTYLNVVDKKPIEREPLYVAAKNHTLGFIYFIQTELGMKHIGLSDEFKTPDRLAYMPYHREGRRLRGVVRFNINHIIHPFQYNLFRTGIAVGDYPVDHHHARYPGKVPPIPFPPVPSFNIPVGALIPADINGLIVCEKGISVSNIVNGTTRLQPAVLSTGQAAGLLAAISVLNKQEPRSIGVRELQDSLLSNQCYIMPYADIHPADSAWRAVQVIGALGLIQGVGKSEGWSNKTYFYPDSLLLMNELVNNINAFFNKQVVKESANPSTKLSVTELVDCIRAINREMRQASNITPISMSTDQLTRKQAAFLLYRYSSLSKIKLDLYGRVVKK